MKNSTYLKVADHHISFSTYSYSGIILIKRTIYPASYFKHVVSDRKVNFPSSSPFLLPSGFISLIDLYCTVAVLLYLTSQDETSERETVFVRTRRVNKRGRGAGSTFFYFFSLSLQRCNQRFSIFPKHNFKFKSFILSFL